MRMRSRCAVVAVLLVVLAAAMLGATTATAEPSSRERVVSRTNASLAAEALKMAKKVDFGLTGAVVTYQAPGDKRPRKLTVGYADYLSATLPGAGPLINILLGGTILLLALGLVLRILALFRGRKPQPVVQGHPGGPMAASATGGHVPERRKGERRKGERRKGERRRTPAAPPEASQPERRKGERRQGERRKGDRRHPPYPAPA